MNDKIDQFKIERGIPVPDQSHQPKYPFHDMVPGDSFFVPISSASAKTVQHAKFTYCLRNPGSKFITKLIKHEGGTRVWCVSR